jgi:phosphatidylglycerophosphate synthase
VTQPLPFIALGRNATRVFGLSPSERARRFAAKAGLTPVPDVPADGWVVIANLDFAWDPAWLNDVASRPGAALTLQGRPVLVHCRDGAEAAATASAVSAGAALPALGLDVRRIEDGGTLYNVRLRKRETPYLMPLDATTAPTVERASYDGAYKGVTDLLTLYLWRRPAFHLTRWAAAAGLTPNMVTSVGAAFCLAAFWLFWIGDYWSGMAAGFAFMVLDTVDGKLARCTGTSSKWGNVFDHGIDLVHPPFWWWAWAHGLEAYGRPLASGEMWWSIAAIVVGYVVQRLAEGVFIRRLGIDMHTWRPIDSRFRLITARRNPNMVILFASMLAGRPDIGLIAVAVWTVVSCIFHLVRLVQGLAARPISSWLA